MVPHKSHQKTSQAWRFFFTDYISSSEDIPIHVNYRLSPQFELIVFTAEVSIQATKCQVYVLLTCPQGGQVVRASQLFRVAPCLQHQVSASWSHDQVLYMLELRWCFLKVSPRANVTFSVNAEVGAIFSRCYVFVVARPPNLHWLILWKKQCYEKTNLRVRLDHIAGSLLWIDRQSCWATRIRWDNFAPSLS